MLRGPTLVTVERYSRSTNSLEIREFADTQQAA